jgi:hypothetical protein
MENDTRPTDLYRKIEALCKTPVRFPDLFARDRRSPPGGTVHGGNPPV